MKKVSAAALALALSAGSALAADLPSHKAPPPPFVPPPVLTWTGFYAGLNAGYSWSNTDEVRHLTGAVLATGALAEAAALGSGFGRHNVPMDGFIGGGQAGYNYQWNNNFVIGIEADIQGSGIRGRNEFFGAGAATAGLTTVTTTTGIDVQRTVDWLGTIRGRAGYLFTPSLLAFVTGGLAYGGVTASANVASLAIATTAIVPPISIAAASVGGIGRFSDTLVGWTAGGGVEWMVFPNVSVKAEYLYYDLGSDIGGRWLTAWQFVPGAGLLATEHRTRFDGHIARAGINYHFNFGGAAPVVASF